MIGKLAVSISMLAIASVAQAAAIATAQEGAATMTSTVTTTPPPSTDAPIIGAAAIVARPDAHTSIRPFTFHASDEALAEMKRRILATQWPEKETVSDQSQGVPLATMQELARGATP